MIGDWFGLASGRTNDRSAYAGRLKSCAWIAWNWRTAWAAGVLVRRCSLPSELSAHSCAETTKHDTSHGTVCYHYVPLQGMCGVGFWEDRQFVAFCHGCDKKDDRLSCNKQGRLGCCITDLLSYVSLRRCCEQLLQHEAAFHARVYGNVPSGYCRFS